MKKFFIIITLVSFALVSCMKASVKIPVTLKDGTKTEITANLERPPGVSASLTFNANTGDVVMCSDSSAAFWTGLTQIGAVAATAAAISQTPAGPALGPLVK